MEPINSFDSLVQLIKERQKPGTKTTEIDDKIIKTFSDTRTILFVDLQGFTDNILNYGIINALTLIIKSREMFTKIIKAQFGIIVKTEGDSVLALFQKPNNAAKAAIEIVKESNNHNIKYDSKGLLITPCMGIAHGEVMVVGDDVFGLPVNIASKLGENYAKGFEILATEAAKELITIDHSFESVELTLSSAMYAYKMQMNY